MIATADLGKVGEPHVKHLEGSFGRSGSRAAAEYRGRA